ncbi:MAG: hypothetical protein WBC44_12220, partial [Planctomycetaceae bacterium]
AAQVASLPDADEPEPPPAAAAPLVVDVPIAPAAPPSPPVVAAAPVAAMQVAPMDPRDPNSPAGLARTALDASTEEGYVYINANGDHAWHNPVIGYYRARGVWMPACRYTQSPYAATGLSAVDDDITLMYQHDLLKNHAMGYDPRFLSPTPGP